MPYAATAKTNATKIAHNLAAVLLSLVTIVLTCVGAPGMARMDE